MDEESDKAYRWEGDYEKTWEALKEDESGSLQESIELEMEKAKKRRLQSRKVNVRLGMMRHVFIVLDMSLAMTDHDLKPNRAVVALKLLEKFVSDFFDQNPIGQLGFITTSMKRASVVSEMSATSQNHIIVLQKLLADIMSNNAKSCQGEPSLQNSLQLAEKTLRHMPSHTSREVLIVFGSLTTCDPNPIDDTLELMRKQKICCSVIGLSAEVHICRKLADTTGGKFGVILEENHFRDMLNDHIPPPAGISTESSLIKMGFPPHISHDEGGKISMCMLTKQFTIGGYYCPQCKAKYTELPVQCVICQLTLVSAPHLARSYHHLFPLPVFVEHKCNQAGLAHQNNRCYACLKHLKPNSVTSYHTCERCKMSFCLDCNLFIHESLHCCPGCINNRCELNTLAHDVS